MKINVYLFVFAVSFFLLLLSPVSAQNVFTVQGVMVDSASGAKLQYVRVGLYTRDSVPVLKANTFTDEAGRFSFKEVLPGQYELNAFLLGYDVKQQTLSIDGVRKNINLGSIAMKKQNKTLEEVSIVTQKPVYMMEGEKTLYNVSEDPTIQDGTASDALQNAPGVEVDVDGNITLRGVSSVEIWINNRPSKMNPDGLKDFIRQMPANAIERIEVITNPSARYSAKGTGGIINVVTTGRIIRNSFISFGLKGSTRPNVSPWLSFVYSKEKLSVNFYFNGGFSVRKSTEDYTNSKLNDDMDTISATEGNGHSQNRNYSGGFYSNGTYDIDSLNYIGWWVGFRPSFKRNTGSAWEKRTELGFLMPETFEFNEETSQKNLSFNSYGGLWYQHVFCNDDRHAIGFDFSFTEWNNNSNLQYNRDYVLRDYLDKKRNEVSNTGSYSLGLSADYTLPYHKNGTIMIGFIGGYDRTTDYQRTDTLNRISDLYQIDSFRLYDAAGSQWDCELYTTIEHIFGNFTAKGGLRLEYSKRYFDIFNASGYGLQHSDLSFYPSLHLTYRTENMHNFKLSYTRRVSIPAMSQLSPFVRYGEDSYSVGNPDLKSTFTHSVEAGYTKFFPKFGFLGVNGYWKYNVNERNTLTDVVYDEYFGRYVTFSQPVNIGRSYRVGADVNVTYRLKSYLNIRFYTNVFYYHSMFSFRDSEDMQTVSNLGYSFRLNCWAKCWKVLEVNVSGNYKSKRVTMFTESRPGFSIDAGLRADFWKRRISVHLNANDIFNWDKSITVSTNPYYSSNSTVKYNSRSISAGVTFRFGKLELESKASQGMGGNDD